MLVERFQRLGAFLELVAELLVGGLAFGGLVADCFEFCNRLLLGEAGFELQDAGRSYEKRRVAEFPEKRLGNC